jgi:endogenous inhibitor of DNA gyrase (YacG/DUF329 family)
MALVLRCPACRKKFPWKSGADLPDDCPLCGAYVGSDRDDSDIVMPFVSSHKAKSMDRVYRQMEAGSERRAELAAEMTGGSKEDFAGLKITNLNDRRDAEVMAIEDKAAAARLTNGRTDQAGTFFQANGAESTVGVSDGSFMLNGQRVAGDPKSARAGMQALGKINRLMGKG